MATKPKIFAVLPIQKKYATLFSNRVLHNTRVLKTAEAIEKNTGQESFLGQIWLRHGPF